MKLVGEAVAEELHKFNTTLTVIGIATWGILKHREQLANPVWVLDIYSNWLEIIIMSCCYS